VPSVPLTRPQRHLPSGSYVVGMDTRADIEVETLLKIVLALVVVWLALEVLDLIIDIVLGPFQSLFGLVIVVLIVLWLLDRI